MDQDQKIQDLFIEHGYSIRTNEKSIITTCLQCGKEDHLYIFRESGFGTCMRCNQRFSPEALVVVLTGCSFKDAKTILQTGQQVKANEGLPSLVSSLPNSLNEKIILPEISMPFTFFPLDPKFTEAWNYVTSRGITQDVIVKYDLRYSPDMQRVVVPVRMNFKCVGWQARDITGKSDVRYMSPKGFNRAFTLMGFDKLNEQRDYVVLSEGPFDMLKLAVLDNTVCSMGKNISRGQLELLSKMPFKKVYLALDPDAFDIFDDIAMFFEPEKTVYIMVPPEGRKDFGECTTIEVLKAFENAKKYSKASQISSDILKA